MLRKILVSLAFVFLVQAAAVRPAEAQCGGAFQVPCLRWDWCAFKVSTIFGPACVGGFVPNTPWLGCNNSRLNNFGLCVPCGNDFKPQCIFAPTCDARHNPLGLCVPCGGSGEPVCFSGAACDEGFRNVFGFCASSGFSTEPTTNAAGMTFTQPGTGPVLGIADLHTHQFSNLGFGGTAFWGAPYDPRGINSALAWCDYTWDFSTVAFNGAALPPVFTFGYEVHGPREFQFLGNPISLGTGEGFHDVAGTGPFDGWPKYNTTTHQQMYYRWLKRAYEGGLRLMVMHAVTNEALCRASKRRTGWSCDDMDAVNRQIQAARSLESAIAARDGGWYRIAYSPAQARQIIREGKLAVVLGIEVDSLFHCKPGTESCDANHIGTQLQLYYNMGVRHVFPIHQFDNRFGGAAIFQDALNVGNKVVTDNHFTARDCSPEYDYNVGPDPLAEIFGLLLGSGGISNQAHYDQFAADCNARGLTPTGRTLIEKMMEQKFIIDIDHMSRLMTDEVLEMARTREPNAYPLVSSHTGYLALKDPGKRNEFTLTDAQLDIMREIGGMVTANSPKRDCATSRDFAETLAYAVDKMKKSEDDEFPAVGFSTDVNGFATSTGPRFGQQGCSSDNPSSRLSYPFTGPLFGGTFQRQQTGQKVFDLNDHGMAHYGLLPDFFADVEHLGVPEEHIDAIYKSAESYIRMWEAIDNSDKAPPPTITAVVDGTLGENGWYTSDVTITWTVDTNDEENNPVIRTEGCGPQMLTVDTKGTTFECQATTGGSLATSSASVTVRRDATPPVIDSATRLTPTPASGWTNANVTVRFRASDAGAGLSGNPTVDVVVGSEGANQTAEHEFQDEAGNVTVASFGGINIDKTPPRVGFAFAHVQLDENMSDEEQVALMQAEQDRWHNAPVTLTVVATDELSDVASVDPLQIVLATEGISIAGSATATDRAGNTITVMSDPVKIDLTPPTIALLSRLPAPNAAGWNNAAVTVNWDCADALSGIEEALVSRTVDGEGDDQSATQICTDMAGNETSHTQGGIRIDLTAPTLVFEAAMPPANANGWNNTDVMIPYVAADNLSGVASVSTPAPLHFAAEGAGLTQEVTVIDVAGNSATFTSSPVQIDKTAPDIAFASRLPAANSHGWNNTDITVEWSCADGLSGVVAPQDAHTLTTEGENQTLTGLCVDLADNSSTHTQGGLSLDKTPPLIACVASPAMIWPPNNRMVAVDVALEFTDALSGTESFQITEASSSEAFGGDVDIAGFEPGLALLAGQFRAQRDGEGTGRTYTLGYLGMDIAGNTAVCSTGVRVPHDLSEQRQR